MRGKLFGDRYRVQQKIGEGGMAYVYVAQDEKLNRKVAIKVLHRHMADNADIRARFFQEAQAISSLDHPNILKIYDFSGETSNELWMVTEILNGVNLNEYVQSFPGRWLHPIVATLIVREIIKALEKAHAQGIVHRDIKPENIFVLNSGAIKLMDFGIAKNTRGNSITMTGTFMGSPSYMSAEQIRGKAVDHRSDIYSLGVLFYEITSGRLPFSGSSTHDVVIKICEGTFKNPRGVNPSIPEDLEKMILKAMAMYPSNRYQEAKSFAADLDIFLAKAGFAESHMELERYFRDRESFGDRLRLLKDQQITVGVAQSNQSSVQKTKTKIIDHKTRMITPSEHQAAAINQAAIEQPPRPVAWVPQQNVSNSSQRRRDHVIPRYRSQSRLIQKRKPRVQRTMPVVYRVAYRRRRAGAGFMTSLIIAALIAFAAYSMWNVRVSLPKETAVKAPRANPTQSQRPPTNESRKAPASNITNPAPSTKPSVVPKRPAVASPKSPQNESVRASRASPTPSASPIPSTSPTPSASPKASIPVILEGEARFSSQPAAEIYIDGQRRGTTVDQTLRSQWIKLKAGTYQLELRRNGYKSFRKELVIKGGDRRDENRIELVPDTNYSLNLSANGRSARVQISNLSTNQSRYVILGTGSQTQTLPAGRYRLRFEFNGEVIERQMILSGPDLTRSMNVTFRQGGDP